MSSMVENVLAFVSVEVNPAPLVRTMYKVRLRSEQHFLTRMLSQD
jgi:hypothetical protein